MDEKRAETVTSASPPNGYFAPESMIWRVSREPLLMLGGGRALLMQVAHPLVAAGVTDHSDYRENPWRRLERTMGSVWTAVYGTRAEADRVGARVRSLHGRVRGLTRTKMGPYPPGTPYSASDPDLLMWVHATLVDSALCVYEGWVGALKEHEKQRYYEDMKVLAGIFGTPQSAIPATLEDFRAYMAARLGGEEICVTPAARDVLESVLDPPIPLALKPAWQALNVVTAGLMPPRLRKQYGLGWDPARRLMFAASREWVRRVLIPLLPTIVRAIPAARKAEREGRLQVAA